MELHDVIISKYHTHFVALFNTSIVNDVSIVILKTDLYWNWPVKERYMGQPNLTQTCIHFISVGLNYSETRLPFNPVLRWRVGEAEFDDLKHWICWQMAILSFCKGKLTKKKTNLFVCTFVCLYTRPFWRNMLVVLIGSA